MTRDQLGTWALLTFALGVAAITWWIQLRPALVMDTTELSELPLRIDEWQGTALPVDSGVERMLRADLNLQRVYQHQGGRDLVWMYVGYYGTKRGGRPEHTPQVCYPSAGWAVVYHRTWIDPEDGFRVNEMRVRRGEATRLVHFWYASSRQSPLLGTWDISMDQLRGRVSDGRADGALIRLSTPVVAEAIDPARQRLSVFRRRVRPELAARWPDERPEG